MIKALHYWTKEEENLIVKTVSDPGYTRKDLELLAKRFGVTIEALKGKVYKLRKSGDLEPLTRVSWTPEVNARLKELYDQDLEYTEIAKIMGVPEGSLKGNIQRLHKRGVLVPRRKAWEDSEIEYIRSNPSLSNEDLGKILNRNSGDVEMVRGMM